MASLRTRSQYIPANKAPVGSPSGPAGGQSARRLPGPNLLRKDNRKSRVDEKMKQRRMSMRYAAPPDFGMTGHDSPNFLAQDPYQQYQYTSDVAPPIAEMDYDDEIPPPPNVMNRQSTYQTSPRTYEERELEADNEERHEDIRPRRVTNEDEWDFSELSKDGVDVQAFIRKNSSGADDEEKARFIAASQKQKQSNAKELETTVFKNYAEFVSISKEISTSENDMFESKESLTEWKGVPQLMGMEDTLAPTSDKDGNVERHRQRRHSPGDLQQLYKQQVTHSWTTVEGSQKYSPIVPGRHLVYEAHTFVELNPATYKAKQNVSLFLLNDSLLVAGRRRFKGAPGMDREAQERGRMVAERCWVLTDSVVVDLKDSGDSTNASKIKRGKEVCVYRGSRPEDKKALLAAFRQVSQELAEKRRKENEAEQERRKTLWQSEAGPNSRMTRMSLFVHEGSTGNDRQLSTIGTSLTNSKDSLWIDDFGDDSTMAIATKDWEEAVRLFERGQDLLRTVQGNKEATEMLKFRLDSSRPPSVEKIAGDLRLSESRKGSAANLISLSIRLDRAELARDTFLAARHEHLEGSVRSIKHEGDIILYINELAIVCFTVIKHTFDWFNNAFNNSRLASGFVTWAKDQIEYFGDIFRRQVYAPTTSEGVISDCSRVTQNANRKQSREIGSDFTFSLNAATERPGESSAAANGVQRTPASRADMGTPRRPTLSPLATGTPSPTPSADSSKGSTAPLSIKNRRPSASTLTPQESSRGELPSRTQRSPQRSPQKLAPSATPKERRPSHGSSSGYGHSPHDSLAPTPSSASSTSPSSQFPGSSRTPSSPYAQRSESRSVSNMSNASASASTLSLSSTSSGPPPTRPERRSRPPAVRSGSSGQQFPHDHI